jgi:hypothetical protein
LVVYFLSNTIEVLKEGNTVDNVNEIKHKLLVDTVDYSEKPDKREIKKISKRLPK